MKDRRTNIPEKRKNEKQFKKRFIGTPDWIVEQARILSNKSVAQDAPTKNYPKVEREHKQRSKQENKMIGQIFRK